MTPFTGIVEYALNGSGSRRRSFMVDGITVYVEPHDDDDARAANVAKRLSTALHDVETLQCRVLRLTAELPPKRPVQLLGRGYVRADTDGRLWLLNRRERGFGEWGVSLDDWDDLFRRYNVRVTEVAADEHGPYVMVAPLPAEPPR
jgi:hypothetical protein